MLSGPAARLTMAAKVGTTDGAEGGGGGVNGGGDTGGGAIGGGSKGGGGEGDGSLGGGTSGGNGDGGGGDGGGALTSIVDSSARDTCKGSGSKKTQHLISARAG